MMWKETGKSRPTIYLTWRDVRQLVEPGIGLGGLGRRYGLGSEEGKGLFPHSGNNNIRKLHLSFSLPNHESEEWTNSLGRNRPTHEEIESAHEEFRRIGAVNRYQYLVYYLKVSVWL